MPAVPNGGPTTIQNEHGEFSIPSFKMVLFKAVNKERFVKFKLILQQIYWKHH